MSYSNLWQIHHDLVWSSFQIGYFGFGICLSMCHLDKQSCDTHHSYFRSYSNLQSYLADCSFAQSTVTSPCTCCYLLQPFNWWSSIGLVSGWDSSQRLSFVCSSGTPCRYWFVIAVSGHLLMGLESESVGVEELDLHLFLGTLAEPCLTLLS